MASNGNHGYLAQTCYLLHFGGYGADECGWRYHLAKPATAHTNTGKKGLVEFLCSGVEELTCGSNGIFAHHLACEHITQCVWHKENLVGIGKGTVGIALHGIQLKERIEIHKLYASGLIYRIL